MIHSPLEPLSYPRRRVMILCRLLQVHTVLFFTECLPTSRAPPVKLHHERNPQYENERVELFFKGGRTKYTAIIRHHAVGNH